MSTDWQNLFKPSDPGIYGPEYNYTPDPRSENPNVPENWGDILGQMLGSYGNVRRAQRNQQAQALLNAWQTAQAQGPEAMQAFLRNPQLPPWFREKVLGGITPETIDPAVKAQGQKIYAEVQSSLKDIYAQAAAIEDPTARDQFIDQQIEALKKAYPDWGSKIPPLPRGTDGHYALPNVTGDPLLDKIVMLPNGKPMTGPDGKPLRYRDLPPAVRAQAEASMVAQQMRSQVTQGRTLAQIAPQLSAILKGTSFEAMLNGPADAFLDEQGQPDLQKIHQLILDANAERDQKINQRSVVWIDPNTKKPVPEGTPGAVAVQSSAWLQYEKPGAGKSPQALAWNARMNALTRFASSIDSEIKGLETALKDPIALPLNSPQRTAAEKRLAALQSKLDELRQQISTLSQEDPDLQQGGGEGAGGRPGWWWYRNQKGVLMDAIRQAEGVDSYGVQKGDYPQNRAGAAQIVDRIFKEWMQAGKPGDFLSYLASKYAPVGAANDPSGLNRNWLRNVSSYLQAHSQPGPGRPAEYTDKDYQALASAAMEQLKKGMSFQTFVSAVLKKNPGMDPKRIKAIWDSIAAKMKGQPNRNIDNVWRWIQHLFPAPGGSDVWNQQP